MIVYYDYISTKHIITVYYDQHQHLADYDQHQHLVDYDKHTVVIDWYKVSNDQPCGKYNWYSRGDTSKIDSSRAANMKNGDRQ